MTSARERGGLPADDGLVAQDPIDALQPEKLVDAKAAVEDRLGDDGRPDGLGQRTANCACMSVGKPG
jgi:hypothetical protein